MNSFGLMHRMKNGWQAESVFISESNEVRNCSDKVIPLRVVSLRLSPVNKFSRNVLVVCEVNSRRSLLTVSRFFSRKPALKHHRWLLNDRKRNLNIEVAHHGDCNTQHQRNGQFQIVRIYRTWASGRSIWCCASCEVWTALWSQNLNLAFALKCILFLNIRKTYLLEISSRHQ